MMQAGTDPETGHYACDGITRNARQCKREASKHFETRDGRCIAHYCPQHAAGAGPTRLLRPFAWEYDRVLTYRGEGVTV
jgi:hypothetical protein